MDRGTLTRSLKGLAEEIEVLRKEELSAGLSTAEAQGRLRDILEHSEGEPNSAFIAASRERIVGGHAEALQAERAAYAHVLATMAGIERPAAAMSLPAQLAEEEQSDDRKITADTLFSTAGKVIHSRRVCAAARLVRQAFGRSPCTVFRRAASK